jgi:hypothetical protein
MIPEDLSEEEIEQNLNWYLQRISGMGPVEVTLIEPNKIQFSGVCFGIRQMKREIDFCREEWPKASAVMAEYLDR